MSVTIVGLIPPAVLFLGVQSNGVHNLLGFPDANRTRPHARAMSGERHTDFQTLNLFLTLFDHDRGRHAAAPKSPQQDLQQDCPMSHHPLPCPLCTSVHVAVIEAAQGVCLDCGFCGPRGPGRDGAVAAWNRHATMAAEQGWQASSADLSLLSTAPGDAAGNNATLAA